MLAADFWRRDAVSSRGRRGAFAVYVAGFASRDRLSRRLGEDRRAWVVGLEATAWPPLFALPGVVQEPTGDELSSFSESSP